MGGIRLSSDPTSIFHDKETLIKIWLDERRSRDFQATLMWENIKYYTTLISVLITADIFILKILLGVKMLALSILSLILPTFIIFISRLAEANLERRWRRFLECVVHLAKLESLLGLHEEIPKELKKVFEDDTYLFQSWVESHKKYSNSNEFIEGELIGDNMFTHLRMIYWMTCMLGVILIIFHIIIFFFM